MMQSSFTISVSLLTEVSLSDFFFPQKHFLSLAGQDRPFAPGGESRMRSSQFIESPPCYSVQFSLQQLLFRRLGTVGRSFPKPRYARPLRSAIFFLSSSAQRSFFYHPYLDRALDHCQIFINTGSGFFFSDACRSSAVRLSSFSLRLSIFELFAPVSAVCLPLSAPDIWCSSEGALRWLFFCATLR